MLFVCGGSDDFMLMFVVLLQDVLQIVMLIKYVVVIYGENILFDYYFGIYLNVMNLLGELVFIVKFGMLMLNGLMGMLLIVNLNFMNMVNGIDVVNLFCFDCMQVVIVDQNYVYMVEEQVEDNGLVDLFLKYMGKGLFGGVGVFGMKGQVMGYFDGNMVIVLWNYVQCFVMSDNMFMMLYGLLMLGVLNVVLGQINGMQIVKMLKQLLMFVVSLYYINDGQGGFMMINDVDLGFDVCFSLIDQVMMIGKNIGDLLNGVNIMWGGFMGGFNLLMINGNGMMGCVCSMVVIVVNVVMVDYILYYNWFQYYVLIVNLQYMCLSLIVVIGLSVEIDGKIFELVNYQYDMDDFFVVVKVGNFLLVSYLKVLVVQDGYVGYLDLFDEQVFVIKVVNFLQQQLDWQNIVVIVIYDDLDGWYDYVYMVLMCVLLDLVDQFNGVGKCGMGGIIGVNGVIVNGCCGLGVCILLVVILLYVKQNYVDYMMFDQLFVVCFIEDNWFGGQCIGGGLFDVMVGDLCNLFDFMLKLNMMLLYFDLMFGIVLSVVLLI